MHIHPSPSTIKHILETAGAIAIVGLSPKPGRPSNAVASYLLDHGFTVIPVNPGHDAILGRPCYFDLMSIPGPIDIVIIFRKSAEAMAIVESAIARGVRAVWMQLGVVNVKAAFKARQAGLFVVMDRCIKLEHMALLS